MLVSDNASTEDLKKLVEDLGDSRFRHVRHSQKKFLHGNWHYSLTQPTTKYVAWLHDDDVWEPDHLKEAVENLERHPGANLYTCAVQHFRAGADEELQRVAGYEHLTEPKVFSAAEALRLWLRRHNTQCSATVFRRSALDGLHWGPLRLQRALDALLIGQVAISGDWIYNPRCTAKYRIHSASLSVVHNKQTMLTNVQALYVYRYLASQGLRWGIFDGAALVREASSWPVVTQGAVTAAFSALGAPRELRKCARALLDAYPKILTHPETTRTCCIARKVGRWYLGVADYVNRVYAGWWPRGDQLNAGNH